MKWPWLNDRLKEQGITSPRPFFGYEQVSEDEKTRRVVKHFNAVARRYDFMNTLLSFGIHYHWKREAVNLLALGAGDRVIDVCGGTGDLARLAAREVGQSGHVVVYDINRAMMDAGRQKTAHLPSAAPIDYIQGNAENITFPDDYFDAAMVGYGIRNVTRMEKGFEEMFRVLKPGGKMMCLEFSKPTARWFRWLYDLYSFQIMPVLGEMIVGSRGAYTHLPESIRTFPLPDALSATMKRIGFNHVFYKRQTNGISVVHIAEK